MLVKTVKIFFFVGVSNILNFSVITYLVKNNAPKTFINELAFFESSLSFVLAAISFGYTQIISRDLVIKKNWKEVLHYSQSARLSFGILLSLLGIILYVITKKPFYALLISPLISLNILFALYSKGKPLFASKLSFYRVLIPVLGLVFIDFIDTYFIILYVLFQIIAVALVGKLSSRKLGVNYLVSPNFKSLKEYVNNFFMGFTDVAISVLQLGVLFVAGLFYEKGIIVNSYLIIKIYVLFKGVTRVIFQIFYHQLYLKRIIFLSEKIISFMGVIFFIALFFYPRELVLLLFSKDYLNSVVLVQILSLSGLASSLHISSTASLLLRKKDREYVFSYFFAVIGLLLGLVAFFHSNYQSYGIIISLFLGEICLMVAVFYFKRDMISLLQRLYIYYPLFLIITLSTMSHLLLNIFEIHLLIDIILLASYGFWFYKENKDKLKAFGLRIN